MQGFQKKVVRHIRKRMEIIAEAQEHYDYDLKGGLRVPLYREIVEEDPETGEKRIVRVPKLLIPEIRFASLNLRDEATERAFVSQLKQMGVPISDKTLGINIPADFDQELEREAQETVDKGMAKAQAFKKMQDLCDLEGLPYPPELAAHLEATLQLRQMLSQTKMLEEQEKAQEMQLDQMSPAGQVGALPGVAPPPPQEEGGEQGGDQQMPPADSAEGAPPEEADTQSTPPLMSGPSGAPLTDPEGVAVAEPARNRSRPAESDEMRANAPRAAKKKTAKTASQRWSDRVNGTRFERGPSSVGHARHVNEQQVQAAIRRRELYARHSTTPLVSQLIEDPNFYRVINMGAHEGQIRADWPEIRAGGAPESAKLLREMLEHYEDVTGVQPTWD
jgi:hypothetical protein